MSTTPFEEAYIAASRRCSRSEQCASDLKTKLKAYELSESEWEKLFERLTAENYLDETRYCYAFINDHIRLSKWGKRKIILALRTKGLYPASFQHMLDDIDESEYKKGLMELLKKQHSLNQKKPHMHQKQKLFQFALQRGFEPNLIQQCVNSIIGPTNAFDEELQDF